MLSTNLHSEEGHQRCLFDWVDLQIKRYPQLALLFAIPNGGYRHKTTAAVLKATGAKPGVPDLLLAWPAGGFHGLFIEMKRPKKGSSPAGVLSPEQKDWIERLRKAGYRVEVCYGFDQARQTLLEYIAS